MKTPHFRLLTRLAVTLLLVGVVVAAEWGLPKNPLIKEPNTWKVAEDRAISMYLEENRDHLVRITGQPHFVQDRTGFECRPSFSVPHEPHSKFWTHVFINPKAAETIKTGKGIYPEGTIILKQKFLAACRTQADFW